MVGGCWRSTAIIRNVDNICWWKSAWKMLANTLLKVPRGCVHHGGKRSRSRGTDRDAAGAQEDKTSGVVWAFTSGKGAARDHANDSPICCPWPQEVFPSKGSYEVGLSLQEAEPSYQDSRPMAQTMLTPNRPLNIIYAVWQIFFSTIKFFFNPCHLLN